MTRTRMVPALVIVLGLATIGGISLVQQRSVDSSDAQLKLANVKIELNQLQTAPFQLRRPPGISAGRAEVDADGQAKNRRHPRRASR